MKDFVFQDVLFEFAEIPSTNLEAKKMVLAGEGGLCFVVQAGVQTAGRGRMERVWNSSVKGNIYMSIALHKSLFQNELLPLFTSLAVMKAIGLGKVQYKWPNDVLVESKKVCGILIERVGDFAIIGIGVNVVGFPLETLFPAGCLADFGLHLSAEDIFKSLQQTFALSPEFLLNTLTKHFFSKGEITINQGQFKGIFKGLNKNGNLILQQQDGAFQTLTFGDVGL